MSSPIQATGHGDLIEAHDGSWWLLFLGIRPVGYPPAYHLGRETFLAPVHWEEGWPVVNGGKLVQLKMEAPTLPLHPWPALPDRDDFDADELGLQWNFLRNPRERDWSVSSRRGFLRLNGSAVRLGDADSPAWVGRRQEHFTCEVTTRLEFEPIHDSEEAGLTIRMNDQHHYDLAVTRLEGRKHILLKRKIGRMQVVTATHPLSDGPVTLRIRSDPRNYMFAFTQDETFIELDLAEIRYIATEAAGGFTGIYFAMYATGTGRLCSGPADFDWFEYRMTADDPSGHP